MINHPVRFATDILLGGLTFIMALTLDQWANATAIIASVTTTSWFAYQIVDKWRKDRRVR